MSKYPAYVALNDEGVQHSEPALFLTTQTTIPILTQMMVAFSLAAVAIAASATWSTPIPLLDATTKDLSLWFIALSVLFFVFATEGCIKSHSWDYFAVSLERREYWNYKDTREYIDKCVNHSKRWHSRAVWSYRIGVFLIVLGAASLFWPLSRITSTIIGSYVPVSLGLAWWTCRREGKSLETPQGN